MKYMHSDNEYNLYDVMKILIIGDLMLDAYYQGEVTRISQEAPVPILKKQGGKRYVPGGACNVAANMIAAGSNVSLAGAVGLDANGEMLLSNLNDKGIDTSLIQKIDTETITKYRFLSGRNQQLLRMDVEDVEDIKSKIDYKALLQSIRERICDFNIIILSDYLKGVLTYDFSQAVLTIAKEAGLKVLVDVKDPHYEKYKGAWLLKPNLKEIKSLTHMPVGNDEEIIEASRHLLVECECEYVLTTCGSRGMVLVWKDGFHRLDTVGREVYDVTGAGDTVIAYLASSLAEGKDIITSMEIANYAAGIQVGKVGTSTVYIQEVREIMDGLGSTYFHKKLRWRDLDSFKGKVAGRKIVFTNGCFDILHVGHKRYLEEARSLGDLLVVGVNSDESVRRLKGSDRPVNTERDRVEMLTALNCVDYVILFEDDTPYDLINRIKPQVLVKGGDYKPEDVVGKDIVESNGGEVVIIPLVEGKSTTAVIEKIKE